MIVGGVLVGQDLIKAAELRKISKLQEEYNTAIMAFRLKYNCLPGDCINATEFGFNDNGDGDKTIDYITGASFNTMESIYFWQHLTSAGLVAGDYSGTSLATCSGAPCYDSGVNVPALRPDSVTTFMKVTFSPWVVMPNSPDGHYMFIGSTSNMVHSWWNGRFWGGLFKPTEQMQLDQKFDDGKPYTGIISDFMLADYTPNCADSETDSDADYNLADDGNRCLLIWKANF